jgi:hypothetical protein
MLVDFQFSSCHLATSRNYEAQLPNGELLDNQKVQHPHNPIHMKSITLKSIALAFASVAALASQASAQSPSWFPPIDNSYGLTGSLKISAAKLLSGTNFDNALMQGPTTFASTFETEGSPVYTTNKSSGVITETTKPVKYAVGNKEVLEYGLRTTNISGYSLAYVYPANSDNLDEDGYFAAVNTKTGSDQDVGRGLENLSDFQQTVITSYTYAYDDSVSKGSGVAQLGLIVLDTWYPESTGPITVNDTSKLIYTFGGYKQTNTYSSFTYQGSINDIVSD